MRNLGSINPRRMISSTRPSSASISKVAACVVAARGLSLTRGCASKTWTGRPWRASANAAMHPTGPPPAINTGRCPAGILEFQSERLHRLGPQGRIRSDHGAEFCGRIAEGIDAVLVKPRRELRVLDGVADLGGDPVDDV